MRRYKTIYKILDDFGGVIKVTSEKPSSEYKYVKEKVLMFDISELGEALF